MKYYSISWYSLEGDFASSSIEYCVLFTLGSFAPAKIFFYIMVKQQNIHLYFYFSINFAPKNFVLAFDYFSLANWIRKQLDIIGQNKSGIEMVIVFLSP